MRRRTRLALLISALGAAAALVVGAGGVASAHVKVSGTDASQGGYGELTFRVPTESDTAATTGLTVTFPDNTPIISVSTQPKAGWSVQVVKKDLLAPQKDDDGNQITQYVSQVIWKAQTPQAAIPPGGFETFSVLAGPLPKQSSVVFPALQTYSDATTVNWNEKAQNGQAEPEHPAPTLTLTSAAGESMNGEATSGDSGSSTASWPGLVGLIVAIVGLLLGIANLALIRNGRSSN